MISQKCDVGITDLVLKTDKRKPRNANSGANDSKAHRPIVIIVVRALTGPY